MPASYHVIITAQALADIQQIFDYIQQRSPQNAPEVIRKILDTIDSLASLPSRHKIVGRSRKTGSRVHSTVVSSYIIYYRVDVKPAAVFVLTIRHGSRRQPRRFK
jgi:plasmid stabilization system protein ParE